MANLAEAILSFLDEKGDVDTLELAKLLQEDHQKIVGAVKSLQSLGNLIEAEQRNAKEWELTEEGKEIVTYGSHEAYVFSLVSKDGIPHTELMKQGGNRCKVGFSKAMSNGWISMTKDKDGKGTVTRKTDAIKDTVKDTLVKIDNRSDNDVNESERSDLKKRKLLQEMTIKSYFLRKGSEFTTKISKPETDLTSEMIANGSWRDKTFKDYNFDALGVVPDCGHLHPLLKVRAEFRQIFLEMGFEEMPTNNYVESSFWNFDALFQPQQHPARDAHDTFFISDPAEAIELPDPAYVERVKTVHETGGYGSIGYRYDWKLDEAKKNLLRTHTTAVSSRMLYKLAQQKEFRPAKYFSIDRVFRNESLDATHLAEFHQIEGVVADRGLSLGYLIGTLYEFYKKLGITKLRFKPAYNPYTEPSMEIFGHHDGLKKWVEVGNSGLFRPEMLRPMGLPEDVVVLGFGLSLERPTMIKYAISNIRDLVGHRVDLQMIYDNPLCRLDKSSAAKNVFNSPVASPVKSPPSHQQRLAALGKHDIVITVDPKRGVPYSIRVMCDLLHKNGRGIDTRLFKHSSLKDVQEKLDHFLQTTSGQSDIKLNVVWAKSHKAQPQMTVKPFRVITGEINILRYLNRLLFVPLESDSVSQTVVDCFLDVAHCEIVSKGGLPEFIKMLEIRLGNNSERFIIRGGMTLVDVYVVSSVLQLRLRDNLPKNVRGWVEFCLKQPHFSGIRKLI